MSLKRMSALPYLHINFRSNHNVHRIYGNGCLRTLTPSELLSQNNTAKPFLTLNTVDAVFLPLKTLSKAPVGTLGNGGVDSIKY